MQRIMIMGWSNWDVCSTPGGGTFNNQDLGVTHHSQHLARIVPTYFWNLGWRSARVWADTVQASATPCAHHCIAGSLRLAWVETMVWIEPGMSDLWSKQNIVPVRTQDFLFLFKNNALFLLMNKTPPRFNTRRLFLLKTMDCSQKQDTVFVTTTRHYSCSNTRHCSCAWTRPCFYSEAGRLKNRTLVLLNILIQR